MTDCRTRYPILLIHGLNCRDDWIFPYWGRVADVLRRHGARVYLSGQDAWGSIPGNAGALRRRGEEILTQTGSGKLDLIAHSKGGLEARYLASSLGLGEHIASVTLIATPNHGSVTMDRLYRLPRWLYRLCGFFINTWFRLLGDRYPDFCAVCEQFTTGWTETFNAANPDVPGLLYRSYAGIMSTWRADFFLCLTSLLQHAVEGPNDGLVTETSARWTGYRGPWQGVGGRGVSHMDEVDFRRRPLRRRGQVWDVVDEYVAMVAELKEMGL